ncbi:hypothetical protein AHiyo4_01490 [Arthrobacter sp. Hiyo4]|nr:hypothetical protein AHiyo4_01490 [Arthrobacter sp. Hiyo4]
MDGLCARRLQGRRHLPHDDASNQKPGTKMMSMTEPYSATRVLGKALS